MKTSRFAILREKFDKSGINGNPVISESELLMFRDLCEELMNTMIDIQCLPLAEYFQRHLNRLDLPTLLR